MNTGVFVDRSFEFGRVEVWLVCLTPLRCFMLDDLLTVRASHLSAELLPLTGLEDGQIKASLKLLARAVDEYAADVLRGDFSIFSTLEERVEKRRQRFRKREQESQNVPKELEIQFIFITRLTDSFCEQYLNDAYTDLCSHLTIMLCRKHPSPLSQGRDTTWACGVGRYLKVNMTPFAVTLRILGTILLHIGAWYQPRLIPLGEGSVVLGSVVQWNRKVV